MTTQTRRRPAPMPPRPAACSRCGAREFALYWEDEDRVWKCSVCSRAQPHPVATPPMAQQGFARPVAPAIRNEPNVITLVIKSGPVTRSVTISYHLKRRQYAQLVSLAGEPRPYWSVLPGSYALARIRAHFKEVVGVPLQGLARWWA